MSTCINVGKAHLLLLTKFELFKGNAPNIINLNYDDDDDDDEDIDENKKEEKNCIILGRGSITKPVNCILSAKNNQDGKEIMSRNHATITMSKVNDNIVYTITDLNSLNGVFVNRNRISACVLHGMYTLHYMPVKILVCSVLFCFVLFYISDVFMQ